ncbi:MAG TPA: TldD/PmbA family protein [Candidatus Limnocylindria bacterium]|nr:TldD/PmbA family protein [Candidatus Limnocylindria bacterium]
MTVLGPDVLLAPLHAALAASGLEEADLWVHRRRAAITRYSHSSIHQNAVSDETHVHARAIVGSAIGTTSGNSLEPGALRELLTRAAELARLQTPNADWPGLASPAPYARPIAFDPVTAALSAAEQASAIGRICEAVERAGFRGAGTHSVDVTEDAVANTNGVAAYAPGTVAYLRALVLGEHGGSGYADDLSHRAAELDPAGIASRAIEKCALDRDRVQLAPGDYEAVFEEDAVAEILRIMSITGLSGQAVREGRSFLAGAIGQQVTGPKFSLHDDALHPGQLAIPFDPEGTPKQRVALVEQGVAKGPAYDRWSAKAAGAVSTGHAADPGRYGHGGHAGNLVMAGGMATRSELIAAVTRGILITRFHYTNTPDPKRATMTGTTRDGTFLVENGKITRALANVRYTMSALDLFAGIDLLGPQRLVRDWWSTNGMGSIVSLAPAMKVSCATITGSSPS